MRTALRSPNIVRESEQLCATARELITDTRRLLETIRARSARPRPAGADTTGRARSCGRPIPGAAHPSRAETGSWTNGDTRRYRVPAAAAHAGASKAGR
jgi:hypothetical protein